MINHSTVLETLKVEFDILDKLCSTFHTQPATITNIQTICVIATVNWPFLNFDSSLEWVCRWATSDAVDWKDPALHIEIAAWTISTAHRFSFNSANCIPPWDRHLIDNPATMEYIRGVEQRDTEGMNKMIEVRNGLARFILTVHGCPDDERITASTATVKNTLQFFIKRTTTVTVNFIFRLDHANF